MEQSRPWVQVGNFLNTEDPTKNSRFVRRSDVQQCHFFSENTRALQFRGIQQVNRITAEQNQDRIKTAPDLNSEQPDLEQSTRPYGREF